MKEVLRALSVWWALYDSSSKRMHHFSAGMVERTKKLGNHKATLELQTLWKQNTVEFCFCCIGQGGPPLVFDLPDFI